MQTRTILRALLFLVIFVSFSCSDDDYDGPPCRPSAVSMKINGELYSFVPGGRGIDLRANGYELQLNFYDDDENPMAGGLFLKMPYKKRGHNVFTEFKLGGINLINEALDSDVIINRSSCFYATFSGSFTWQGEEMVITEGSISYEYDEPFDE